MWINVIVFINSCNNIIQKLINFWKYYLLNWYLLPRLYLSYNLVKNYPFTCVYFINISVLFYFVMIVWLIYFFMNLILFWISCILILLWFVYLLFFYLFHPCISIVCTYHLSILFALLFWFYCILSYYLKIINFSFLKLCN